MKIYRSKNQKLIKIFNHSDKPYSLDGVSDSIWFGAIDWYNNKSLLIIDNVSDGGYSSTYIGYLDIYLNQYFSILKKEMGECSNEKDYLVEMIEFNGTSHYKIASENPKIQTGYFTMQKPKADDYDKLLETCKRDPKNSILVKPTTIVRKNYTFKINSKKASLYFKGKDLLNSGDID